MIGKDVIPDSIRDPSAQPEILKTTIKLLKTSANEVKQQLQSALTTKKQSLRSLASIPYLGDGRSKGVRAL